MKKVSVIRRSYAEKTFMITDMITVMITEHRGARDQGSGREPGGEAFLAPVELADLDVLVLGVRQL
jgi:hypothetical protein